MENWGGKAPKVALKLRIESGEWRIDVEKLRFSSIIHMVRNLGVCDKGRADF